MPPYNGQMFQVECVLLSFDASESNATSPLNININSKDGTLLIVFEYPC